MSLRSLLASCLIAAALLPALAAQAQVDVTASPEQSLGIGALEYRLDDPGQGDPAVALTGSWQPIADDIPNFGYTDASVWLRAQLVNSGSHAGDWLLEVAYPNLDLVQLWLRRDGQLGEPITTGDLRPFAERPVVDRNFVFPLALAAGENVEILLRVESTTSVQVPLRIYSPAAFREHVQDDTLVHGIFFGMLLLMLVYNLAIWAVIRERSYLYYVAFVSSFCIYQAFHHGFSYAYLWPSSPWWHAKSGAIAIHLTLAFAALFANSFLGLPARRPRAARAVAVLAVLAGGGSLLALAVPHSVSARLASLLALIECPLVFAIGLSLWRQGMRGARFFVFAWVVFLLGATLFALSKLGVAPHNAVTENALQIGSVIEVVLLSFALADRFNEERRQRHRARVDALQRQQEAAALSRFVPPGVSERVVAGQADALAHARREVAILCAVPTGFLESLSSLATEQVAPPVNRFVDAMSDLARRHGGVVDRFVGPRISVLFGALDDTPVATTVPAAAAMAEEMQRELNELVKSWERDGPGALRLRMAVGIATGPAMVGIFGDDRRVEYSALGPPMVRAHQLASEAIPGEVRLDQATADALREQLPVVEGPPIEYAPGRASPSFRLGPAAGSATPAADVDVDADADTIAPTTGGDGPPILAPGSELEGRYRIVDRVGRGGSAVVYRAIHLASGAERALKLIGADQLREPYLVEQLRREARATARIHHPGVVRLHDFGRSVEGHYYLAFDYVDGGSLAERLEQGGRLDPDAALVMGREILAALDAAHRLELVHRDVKPANVLIDGDGRIRVTDFGLVLPVGDGDGRGDGPIVGTPRYMSPEQTRGEPLDARSDLYSFGVTLYEMLSGTLPYHITGGLEVIEAVRHQPPIPLPERGLALAPAIWDAIEQCLAKSPSDRPSSAAEVAALLARDGQQSARAARPD